MSCPPPTNARVPLGRDFDRFWLASAVSNLGDGIRLGALPLLATALTDDARLIGLATASATLPWLLLGPVGGAIVDRFDRRRLIVAAQLIRAVAVTALITVMATDAITIWWLLVVGFVLGAGEIIADTSSQAAVPMLVDDELLDRANGRLTAATTLLNNVVGLALGSVLYATFVELPFLVDAATFAVAAALVIGIRRPLQPERIDLAADDGAPGGLMADIVTGGRFLLGHPFLRDLTLGVTLSNFAGNVVFGMLVVLVVDELGAPEAAFGTILALGAVGGVVGSLVAGWLAARFGRNRVLSAMPFLVAVSYLAFAVAGQAWMVSAAFFCSSFAVVCFSVPAQSLRQSVTPDELLGRVVATSRTIGFGVAPLGALLGGAITNANGVRSAMWTATALEVVAALVLLAVLQRSPTRERQGVEKKGVE